MTKTLRHLFVHFLLVLPIIFFFPAENKIPLLGVAILGGYFPDLDHLFDYFLFTKKAKFELSTFLEANYFASNGKVYVLLHSWEIIALLWIFFIFLKPAWIGLAFTAGYTIHVLFDQYSYPIHHLGYFLLYRLINHFDKKRVCLD